MILNIKNMKKYIYILFGLMMFFPISGCDVEDQLFQDVPESNVLFARSWIGKEIYVAPNMVDTKFDVIVYRSGVNNSSSVNVRLGIDEQVLADYNESNNTGFTMLPQAYYAFDSNITIESGKQNGISTVTIHAAKISTELGFDENYAIPFVIENSDNANISEEKGFMVLNLNVREPVILQETYGILEASAVGTGIYKKTLNVYVEFENEWDLDLRYELDYDLIDDYNQTHDTEYLALQPENIHGLPADFRINSGESSVEVEISISADGLEYFDPLMLPLRLVSLSDFMVAEGKEIIYVLFTRQFDPASAELIPLTADMIDAWTQETSEGPKENLVDGDTGTYWHSAWSAGVEPLPHWIQINFSEATTIGGMNYTFRQPSGITDRPNHWDIQVSDDGSNWTTVWISKSGLPVEPVDAKQTLVFDQSYTSRFFRIRVLDTYGSRDWTHLSTIEVFSIIE
jgi:hypothetical protein